MNAIKTLALELPGIGRVNGYPGIDDRFDGATLGTLISEFASLALLIAAFLMFIWFVWGVFEYIFAGGNKEGIGKARKRMTWAIVGFILFTISFAVSEYASTLLDPQDRSIPESIQRDSIPNQNTPINVPGGGNQQRGITR